VTGENEWSGRSYDIWCEGGYVSCKMALEEVGGQLSGYHSMAYPDYTEETFPVTKDTNCKAKLKKYYIDSILWNSSYIRN